MPQSDRETPQAAGDPTSWLLLSCSLVEEGWSWLLSGAVAVAGAFVCAATLASKTTALWFHQAQLVLRCPGVGITSEVTLANSGELSPFECRFNALRR